MREIKFRAWFKNEGEMKNVNMNNVYEGNKTYLHLSPMPISDYKAIELMQCTGLKDKNGREIYEGDIIAYIDSIDVSTESGYDFCEFMNKGQIIFNEKYGRFDVTNRSDIDYFDFVECTSEYEIIGNIYENPELLEVVNQ